MTDYFSQLGFSHVLEEEPEVRDFIGYRQQMEEDEKGRKHWVFYAAGLDGTISGENGFCHVLKSVGSEEQISIDKHDCILLNGRRYDRSHWNH